MEKVLLKALSNVAWYVLPWGDMQIAMCVNERTLAEMTRSWFSKKEKEMIRSLDGMCSRWYTTNGLYPYNFIISFSVIGSSCQGYYFFFSQ